MNKSSKVHFLTAYVEYLFDRGIRSEESYVGDASRFVRFLLANATEDDIQRFIHHSAQSSSYEHRLRKTLRKFFCFTDEVLSMKHLPHLLKKPDDNPSG